MQGNHPVGPMAIIDDPVAEAGICGHCHKRPKMKDHNVCETCYTELSKKILEATAKREKNVVPTTVANIIDNTLLQPGMKLKIGDQIVRVLSAGADFLRVEIVGKHRFKADAKGEMMSFGVEDKKYFVSTVTKRVLVLRVVQVEESNATEEK